MTTIKLYLEASERENTRRSYDAGLRHFEVEWGGHLPATPDSVACYLAENANDYAINTLKQRLAALAHWHHEHEGRRLSPARRSARFAHRPTSPAC